MNKQLTEIDRAIEAGDIKQAEILIAKLLRGENPPHERAEILIRRARVRLHTGRPDDALEDLQTGLALLPEKENNPDIQILKGDIYFARFELAPVGFVERTDMNDALQCYQAVVDKSPNHAQIAWVHFQMGRIQLNEDRIEAAVNAFQKSLEHPAQPVYVHALSYERLGFIEHFENRNPRKALEYFQQATGTFPEKHDPGWVVQLYIRISRAHLELHSYESALEAARRALQTIQSTGSAGQYRSALSEAHLAIGDILAAMQGNETEAIEHYLRFLQTSKRPAGIDVTWSQIYQNIGNLSFRLEKYDQAINAYEKSLELNPYHPMEVHLRYQIARCHYRARAYEKAVSAIEKLKDSAIQEDEPVTDWRVFNLLGNSYFAIGKYDRAVIAYEQAIALAPAGATGINKAHIYLKFSKELAQTGD